MWRTSLFVLVLIIGISLEASALKKDECGVCVDTVSKFSKTLTSHTKSDYTKIETEFKKHCQESRDTQVKSFCYYLGGMPDSATSILGELSKPLSWSLPAERICEKLKKKDGQICELRLKEKIDLNTVNLKKVKVRDLKNILNEWNEECDGCIEKSDYIKRIEELKPKYLSKTEL